MNTYLENLNWRYATKMFDPSKKVSPQDLEKLLSSIQLTASSYGLQPYEVLVIENEAIREQLKPAAWNQTQITDASHLLVFASFTSLSEEYVQSYLQNISTTREVPLKNLNGFLEMLQNTVLQQASEDQATWAANQTYIAMGNLLSAAASYKIDTCPMEGFDAAKFDEILGLKEKGLTTTVIAPIGYRSKLDNTQHAIKVRKSKKQLFHLL